MKTQSKKIIKLLADLSNDPKVKSAIDQLKQNYNSGPNQKISNFKDLALVTLKIGAKFVGRKRARVVQDTLDAVGILIQVSFLIKTNVFDRPEVQTFFKELWQGIQVNWQVVYNNSKNYVDEQLRKLKKTPMKDVVPIKKDPPKDQPDSQ